MACKHTGKTSGIQRRKKEYTDVCSASLCLLMQNYFSTLENSLHQSTSKYFLKCSFIMQTLDDKLLFLFLVMSLCFIQNGI